MFFQVDCGIISDVCGICSKIQMSNIVTSNFKVKGDLYSMMMVYVMTRVCTMHPSSSQQVSGTITVGD